MGKMKTRFYLGREVKHSRTCIFYISSEKNEKRVVVSVIEILIKKRGKKKNYTNLKSKEWGVGGLTPSPPVLQPKII